MAFNDTHPDDTLKIKILVHHMELTESSLIFQRAKIT